MSYSDPAAGAAPGVAPAVTAAFQLLPAQELAMSVRLMGQAFALLANGASEPFRDRAHAAGFVLSRALTYALGRGRDDRRFFRALLAFVTFLEVLQTGMIFAAMHSSFIDNFGKPTALALPWMAATANILGSVRRRSSLALTLPVRRVRCPAPLRLPHFHPRASCG